MASLTPPSKDLLAGSERSKTRKEDSEGGGESWASSRALAADFRRAKALGNMGMLRWRWRCVKSAHLHCGGGERQKRVRSINVSNDRDEMMFDESFELGEMDRVDESR